MWEPHFWQKTSIAQTQAQQDFVESIHSSSSRCFIACSYRAADPHALVCHEVLLVLLSHRLGVLHQGSKQVMHMGYQSMIFYPYIPRI